MLRRPLTDALRHAASCGHEVSHASAILAAALYLPCANLHLEAVTVDRRSTADGAAHAELSFRELFVVRDVLALRLLDLYRATHFGGELSEAVRVIQGSQHHCVVWSFKPRCLPESALQVAFAYLDGTVRYRGRSTAEEWHN